MNILVIGSEGTIGKPLVNKLKGMHGARVFRCDRIRQKVHDYYMADISHYETLESIFEVKPDIVFHLAGEVSRESAEYWPNIAVENNIIGTLNIVRLCLKHKAKIVFAGTSEEYGGLFADGVVVAEDMRPVQQQGIYGLTKWLAEEMIEYYSLRYALRAVIVRIFMCYGPGEIPNFYRSALTRFIDAARRGEPLHVHRGGERSWCYIDDTVSGLIVASGYDHECFSIFNIGNDEMISTQELAKKILDLTHSKSTVVLEDAPAGVTLVKKASFKKAIDVLGWKAQVPFAEGLQRTIDWHVKNITL